MPRLLRFTLLSTMVTILGGCGGDAETDSEFAAASDTATTPAAGDMATPAGAMAPPEGLLDPETAGREELTAIGEIDAALADSIIAGRPYQDMTEVDSILAGSLDEAQREQVYRRLWKPIDLNNASDEEILLIPGVGDRMLHEFDEYRPYQAIEQFRREIGKYVDDEEVARLEQYVEIR